MSDDFLNVIGTYVFKRIAAILFIGAAYFVTMSVFMRIDLERQQEQEKKSVIEHLEKDYPFGGKVEIKRGYYAGCTGNVVAHQQFLYVVLVNLENLKKIHVQVHAKDFDDATMNYMAKFVK